MFRILLMAVSFLLAETSLGMKHKFFDGKIIEQTGLYLPLHPSEPTKLYVLNTQLKHIAEALQERTLSIAHPSKEGLLGTMTIAHSSIQRISVKTSINRNANQIQWNYYPIASTKAADIKIDLDDQAVDAFFGQFIR